MYEYKFLNTGILDLMEDIKQEKLSKAHTRGVNDLKGTGVEVSNRLYDIWRSMIRSCYARASKSNPRSVVEEWMNLSGFVEWVGDRDVSDLKLKIRDNKTQYGDDIIVTRGRVYGPESCFFVNRGQIK